MSAQDVIGRAIHEHDANASMGGVEWPTWEELGDEGRAAYGTVSDDILDGLASAGYAVVELPEPTGALLGDPAWRIGTSVVSPCRDGSIYAFINRGETLAGYGALYIAGALIAAANLAAAHAEGADQ